MKALNGTGKLLTMGVTLGALFLFTYILCEKTGLFWQARLPGGTDIYVISCLFFCVLLLSLAKLAIMTANVRTSFLNSGTHLGKVAEALVSVVAAVGAFAVYILMWRNMVAKDPVYDPNSYWWDSAPLYVVIGIVALGALLGIAFERSALSNRQKKLVLAGLSVVAMIFQFYNTYYRYPYEGLYEMHHTGAIYTSVYNAYYGEPYSAVNFSTYGHYGILLAPIFHLVGGLSLPRFSFLMAMLAVFCVGAVCFIACVYIKNDLICALTILSSTFLYTWQGGSLIAYQGLLRMFPLLLMSVTFALISKFSQKRSWVLHFLSYCVAAFCFIWNTEAGTVCLLATTFFWLEPIFLKQSILSVRFWLNILKELLFLALAFCGAFCFVNTVNVVMGGDWLSLREFSPSLMSSRYMSGLADDFSLRGGNLPWVHIAALFLFFIGRDFLHWRAFGFDGSVDLQRQTTASLAIIGLGGMVYYTFRPHHGTLYVVFFSACLMLGIFSDACICAGKNLSGGAGAIAKGVSKVLLLVMVCFAVFTWTSQFVTQEARENAKTASVETFENTIESLRGSIPDTTFIFGNGSAMLYTALHWDPEIYVSDVACWGMTEEYSAYVKEYMAGSNRPLLIEKSVLDSYIAELEKPDNAYQQLFPYHVYATDIHVLKDQTFLYFIPDSMQA